MSSCTTIHCTLHVRMSIVYLKFDFDVSFVFAFSLVTIAREQLHILLQKHDLSYFDFNKPEGKALITILLDLLKYDNDTLNLSSCKLLFDIHQVCLSYSNILI